MSDRWEAKVELPFIQGRWEPTEAQWPTHEANAESVARFFFDMVVEMKELDVCVRDNKTNTVTKWRIRPKSWEAPLLVYQLRRFDEDS